MVWWVTHLFECDELIVLCHSSLLDLALVTLYRWITSHNYVNLRVRQACKTAVWHRTHCSETPVGMRHKDNAIARWYETGVTEGPLLTANVASVDDGKASVCCRRLTDIFLAVCPLFSSASTSSSFFVILQVVHFEHPLSLMSFCLLAWGNYAICIEHFLYGFVVCSLVISWLCDKTRVWRVDRWLVDHVMRWLCGDELTGSLLCHLGLVWFSRISTISVGVRVRL